MQRSLVAYAFHHSDFEAYFRSARRSLQAQDSAMECYKWTNAMIKLFMHSIIEVRGQQETSGSGCSR